MFYLNGSYCVYVHTNKANGKMYVGQTCQKPERRWQNGHGYLQMTNGQYRQPHFARAILKHGWNGFEHEVIASGLTKEEANNFEKLLIEKLQTQDKDKGYNICSGGNLSNGNTGKTFTEEHKQKISESRRANKHDSKKVAQYTKDGIYLRTWDGMREAEKELGINHSSISKCCRKQQKTAGGFIWCYIDQEA